MIEYISTIMAFVALIAGIVGDTWNKKRKGIKKITATGWIILGVGCLALGTSLYENYQNDWEARQRAKVTNLAYQELDVRMELLMVPLTLLYSDVCSKYSADCSMQRYNVDLEFKYGALASESFLKHLPRYMTLSKPDSPPGFRNSPIPWGHWFSESARFGEADLNEVWLKYGPYYDYETLLQIHALQEDKFFRAWLNLAHGESDALRNGDVPLSVFFADIDEGNAYLAYLEKVRALQLSAREKCRAAR